MFIEDSHLNKTSPTRVLAYKKEERNNPHGFFLKSLLLNFIHLIVKAKVPFNLPVQLFKILDLDSRHYTNSDFMSVFWAANSRF